MINVSYIQKLCQTYGTHNVEVIIPIAPAYNKEKVSVTCSILETRHLVKNGYKITLKPKEAGFKTKDIYQLELVRLVNTGKARFRVLLIDETYKI